VCSSDPSCSRELLFEPAQVDYSVAVCKDINARAYGTASQIGHCSRKRDKRKPLGRPVDVPGQAATVTRTEVVAVGPTRRVSSPVAVC
jgi:hypothetical protein